MSALESHEAQESEEGCLTPVENETTVTVAYLDAEGAEQFVTLRTTESQESLRNNGKQLQFALKTAFAMTGRQILSMQASIDHTIPLIGRQRPVLRLV